MLVLVTAAACAGGKTAAPIDAPEIDARAIDGRPGNATTCADGQLATNIDGSGNVTCAPIDGATQAALDERCSAYLGWRDSCNGCTDDPAKWGFVSGAHCTNGTGQDDTCTMATLGPDLVPLFGLSTDGDVNGDDKLYLSLHCVTAERMLDVAPCPAGQFVTGKTASGYSCEALVDAVVDYVGASCVAYLGWQDSCDGCTNPPAKWGLAGDSNCTNGAGQDDSCTTPTLGGQSVKLFGVSPDGDVDGNDKLHIGLACAPGATTNTDGMTCPTGEFVAGTNLDGTVHCTSAAAMIQQYFEAHCSLYLGWRDSCDGCTDPPAKWGRVHVGNCTNGAGLDDTCSSFTLGGKTISMFGLSPDGNVDGNDKLYVGFQCR